MEMKARMIKFKNVDLNTAVEISEGMGRLFDTCSQIKEFVPQVLERQLMCEERCHRRLFTQVFIVYSEERFFNVYEHLVSELLVEHEHTTFA